MSDNVLSGELEGKLVANRYIISHRVGEGPIWTVYLAQDIKSGEAAAVKVMRPEVAAEPEATPRFLKQAEDAFKLAHPNIVRTIGTGTEGGRHFLICEYVYGRNLRQWFAEEGRTFSDLRDKLKTICEALAYAHSNGIFHRALKPENIFVDQDDKVRITDFGFAQRLEGCTRSRDGIGAVAYITPEQARGQRGDARSDLYSLGVVLYELATNKLPFSGGDSVRVVFRHINEVVVRPRQINPRVPAWLDHVVRKLLEKDPNQRYQSTRELYEELVRLERQAEGQFIEMPSGEGVHGRHQPGYVPLVGREEPSRLLRERLAQSADGKGSVVLVSGPCGSGKTRLMGELTVHAGLMAATSLHGRACRGRGLPFAAFARVVADFLRQTDVKLRDVLPEDGAALEAFLEGRADEALAPDPAAFLNRYRGLFLSLIDKLAARSHLVLVIEELANLDELSLRLLRLLAERARSHRLLLVVTAETTALKAGTAAMSLFEELSGDAANLHIPLSPLEAEDVRQMLCLLSGVAQVPDDLVSAVLLASGGIPLHLEEMTALLLRDKALEVVDGTLRAASLDAVLTMDGLTRLFERRISTLPQKVGMLLAVASCVGSAFDLEVLLKVAGKPHDEVTSVIQWAERNRFLEPDPFGRRERWRFRHDILREVAYNALDARSRKRMHLLVGGALEECFASRLREVYEELCWQYRESDQWEKAIEYATLAAERFYALGMPEAARAYYVTALDLSGLVAPDSGRRLHFLKRLSLVSRSLEDTDGSRRYAEQALQVAKQSGDEAEEREIQELLAFRD